MKKIICFIDDLCLGGAQRQLVGLAILLKSHGYDVRFCTYHNDKFYHQILVDNNISYDYSPLMESRIRRIPEFIKYIRRERPDVVISYIEGPCVIASIAKLTLRNFKLIVSERNTSQRYSLIEKIRFSLFKYADAIIPNSYSQAKFIKSHHRNLLPKIKVITNFVDTTKFTPSLSNSTCNSIVSIGRITPQKNILTYLKAIKLIKLQRINIHFDWYGDTDNPQYLSECVSLIHSLDIADYFTFHPATKNVIQVYQNALALCLPSIYEGFPNVICEAMSCGLPILCSNVCDNPDIVKEDVNGFMYNPLVPEDIFKSINRLISLDETSLKQIKSINREESLSRFSVMEFYDQYKKIIEND